MNTSYGKTVEEEINNLLKVGFIVMVFPIIVLPKRNEKLRTCVKYKNINAQIICTNNEGSISITLFIDSTLDMVGNHEIYNFMDKYNDYNLLSIALEDRPKITFIIK